MSLTNQKGSGIISYDNFRLKYILYDGVSNNKYNRGQIRIMLKVKKRKRVKKLLITYIAVLITRNNGVYRYTVVFYTSESLW